MRFIFPVLYLALLGSYIGLEIDTYVSDVPHQITTLILFANLLWIPLFPPLLYALFSIIESVWKNRAVKAAVLVLNTLFIHIAAFLAVYKSVRRIDFDYNFLRYNTADALPTLWKLYAPWFFAVALSLILIALLQKPFFSLLAAFLRKSPLKRGALLAAIFGLSILCQAATIVNVRGSGAGFLFATFLSDRRIRTDYQAFYRNHIDKLRRAEPRFVGPDSPSMLGDVIFVVKQESLNGLLVSRSVTPQLLQASADGILFSDFYANSIQSLRGYECILCGVAPNIAGALIDEYKPEELRDLSCLPKIFKSLGYRTLYFFGGSRNARIMRFADAIGFEKVLADDIMRPGDVKFDWGYREDVFYHRMYEYLQQRHPNDKLFVFIDTGATNHTPFEVLDSNFVDKVPFPRPSKFEERLSNATFVQDAYLGYLFRTFKERYGSRGSMLVASDHSWPIPLHKHNIYNERGAYEENFRIPFLLIPPASMKDRYAAGAVVKERFSQMDIFPTILSLIGMEQEHLLGESFAPWLLAGMEERRSSPARTKILIQPYGGGFISAVRYPDKYLFDVLGKRYAVFDLKKDPQELAPAIRKDNDHAYLIHDFFHPGASAGQKPGVVSR